MDTEQFEHVLQTLLEPKSKQERRDRVLGMVADNIRQRETLRERALTGETVLRPTGPRVPMNVDEEVRESLRVLLYEPEMRGVGYSEFIARAVRAAWHEILTERQIEGDV